MLYVDAKVKCYKMGSIPFEMRANMHGLQINLTVKKGAQVRIFFVKNAQEKPITS